MIILYTIAGVIWAIWLEYYTDKHFDLKKIDKEWTTQERLFHIVLWPLNLTIFIIAFVRGINGDDE
jgi:hypothetical protein